MKSRIIWCALASALAFGGVGMETMAEAESRETIRFGVLPVNQPETMAKRFEPLIAYLEKITVVYFLGYGTGNREDRIYIRFVSNGFHYRL